MARQQDISPSGSTAERIEAVDDKARGVAVEFTPAGDRYEHAIFLVEPAERRRLLTSVEGSARDPWPPSPPLQQLTRETRSGGRSVALVIGQSGVSHWSLSAATDPPGRQITFEAACRVKSPPARLGSRYRRVKGIEFGVVRGGTILLRAGDAEIELTATGEVSAPPQLLPDGELVDIALSPAAPSLPVTVRWKYTFRLR